MGEFTPLCRKVTANNSKTENYGEAGDSEKLEGNTLEKKTFVQLMEGEFSRTVCLVAC